MFRDQAVTEAFVSLSDMLVDDVDVGEFLHLLARRGVELLDARLAGVMVADEHGVLRLLAASSERASMLELLEIGSAPFAACFTTGLPVSESDLSAPDPRWAVFAGRAREIGFRSVHALPMRLRGETIGVLNLFRDQPGPLDAEELRLGQALANVSTVGLLHHRRTPHRRVVAEQLQHVLTSRVVVERAKGVLAEHFGMDIDTAAEELCRHAARTGQRLSTTADSIVNGTQKADKADKTLLIRRFDMGTLKALRDMVSGWLTGVGLEGMEQYRILLAIHEVAANAVRHGGGSGRMWLWHHRDTLWCEISDDGPGLPAGFIVPTGTPMAGDLKGRGLWLVNQVSPGLEITNTLPGTRLLLSYPLHISG